jgi:hypothetical protein
LAQEFDALAEACEAFLLSINEGRYYDAHEDLEVHWYPNRFEDDDEVRLLKGFINAAVCFELIRLGRSNPSQTAWKTYFKYSPLLETLESSHYPLYVKMRHLIEEKHGMLCAGFLPKETQR